MKTSLFTSGFGILFLCPLHVDHAIGAEGVRPNPTRETSASVSARPLCPAGYRLFNATDCVAADGTTFVFERGGWYRKTVVPGGIVIENVLNGAREYSDGSDFVRFIPLNCVWVASPYQYTYTHGTRMMTTNGQLWDCNNGRFYYAGYVPQQPAPQPGYRPYPNEDDLAHEERERAGVGANGTIGRGTGGN